MRSSGGGPRGAVGLLCRWHVWLAQVCLFGCGLCAGVHWSGNRGGCCRSSWGGPREGSRVLVHGGTMVWHRRASSDAGCVLGCTWGGQVAWLGSLLGLLCLLPHRQGRGRGGSVADLDVVLHWGQRMDRRRLVGRRRLGRWPRLLARYFDRWLGPPVPEAAADMHSGGHWRVAVEPLLGSGEGPRRCR